MSDEQFSQQVSEEQKPPITCQLESVTSNDLKQIHAENPPDLKPEDVKNKDEDIDKSKEIKASENGSDVKDKKPPPARRHPLDISLLLEPRANCIPIIDQELQHLGPMWIDMKYIIPTKGSSEYLKAFGESKRHLPLTLCHKFLDGGPDGLCFHRQHCRQAHISRTFNKAIRDSLRKQKSFGFAFSDSKTKDSSVPRSSSLDGNDPVSAPSVLVLRNGYNNRRSSAMPVSKSSLSPAKQNTESNTSNLSPTERLKSLASWPLRRRSRASTPPFKTPFDASRRSSESTNANKGNNPGNRSTRSSSTVGPFGLLFQCAGSGRNSP